MYIPLFEKKGDDHTTGLVWRVSTLFFVFFRSILFTCVSSQRCSLRSLWFPWICFVVFPISAWRNLNSTPFVFTGDGLKHRPVPDLTLGTPFNPPEGLAARFCWFLGLPINIAYFFTIPDVKKESCQKWVAVSFIVCIAWIAVSSYTLVWMVLLLDIHLRSRMQSWVLHSSLLEAVYQIVRQVCSSQEKVS